MQNIANLPKCMLYTVINYKNTICHSKNASCMHYLLGFRAIAFNWRSSVHNITGIVKNGEFRATPGILCNKKKKKNLNVISRLLL